MHVLLVTSAYPAHAGDSRGTFIRVLAQSLVRAGMEVTLLAPGAPGAPSREMDGEVRVRRATYWIPRWQSLASGLGGIVPNLRRRPWLIFQVPALLASLGWAARRLASETDLVHAHWLYPAGIAGVVATWERRLPLLVTSHGGDLNLSQRWAPLRWISRRVAQRAACCIGVSHAMVDAFRNLGIPAEKVEFLPLGVDVSSPISEQIEEQAAYRAFRNAEALRIVYVGSLIPRKSVETLLEAHALLERRGMPVSTLLVGAGPEEARLRALVEELEMENVFFAGEQPPHTVPAWIRLADVLVLPSRSEGRGMVLVEAMALGVAVVASDIPGPRELVESGANGFLFPPQDAAALADQLDRLVHEPALRQRLADAGRAYVKREGLTPEACARRHRELYERVLESSQSLAESSATGQGYAG